MSEVDSCAGSKGKIVPQPETSLEGQSVSFPAPDPFLPGDETHNQPIATTAKLPTFSHPFISKLDRDARLTRARTSVETGLTPEQTHGSSASRT
jgi:hypothetical protein